MCVTFWSFQHPDYSLIICANRDEYLSRPTLAAAAHTFDTGSSSSLSDGTVISGRDKKAGGTWMGVNTTGRIAVLTNITEPYGHDYASSRGQLTSSFLVPETDGQTFDEYISSLANADPSSADYAGFNLLVIELKEGEQTPLSALITNGGGGGKIKSRSLRDDECICGGLSNGVDGQTMHQWTKVTDGLALFEPLLRDYGCDREDDLVEKLIEFLGTTHPDPLRNRDDLKKTISVTPFTLLSDYYGTRLSTVILVKRTGEALFVERDVWTTTGSGGNLEKGDPKKERKIRFHV